MWVHKTTRIRKPKAAGGFSSLSPLRPSHSSEAVDSRPQAGPRISSKFLRIQVVVRRQTKAGAVQGRAGAPVEPPPAPGHPLPPQPLAPHLASGIYTGVFRLACEQGFRLPSLGGPRAQHSGFFHLFNRYFMSACSLSPFLHRFKHSIRWGFFLLKNLLVLEK